LAHHLIEQGHKDIKILEALSRIGSRLYTDYMECNHPVDIGGTWIGEAQTEIMYWVRALDMTYTTMAPFLWQACGWEIITKLTNRYWNPLVWLDYLINVE
jgi:monoamine oxidase